MVWINDSEFTRSSVCFARRNLRGIDNLERILDYRRDVNGAASYQWVCRSDDVSRRTDPDDPKTLYRPETIDALQKSGEDFLFVKWKPNTANPERPTVKDPYTHPYDLVPNCYEVINNPAESLEQLRNQLADGWTYAGMPTAQVLVLYADEGDHYDAVLLDRADLDLSGNRIRLRTDAPLSAEHYEIARHDIKYLPGDRFVGEYDRAVYINPELPRSQGAVLIRPLRQYALHYMRRYLDKVHGIGSGIDWPRFSAMLDEAMRSPQNLAEFGIALSTSDTRKMTKAIARLVNDDERMKELAHDVLVRNPDFKDECVTVCRQELHSELDRTRKDELSRIEAECTARRHALEQGLQQKRDELSQLEQQVRSRSDSYKSLTTLIEPLRQQVDDMNRRLDQANAEVRRVNKQAETDLAELEKLKEAELRRLDEQRSEALDRLENDVALKLGLDTVMRSLEATLSSLPPKATSETPTAPTVRPLSYPTIQVRQGEKDFTETLADNLQAFGVISVDGSSAALSSLAQACERSLSATRLVAVDSAFAAPLANALSYAGNGRPAKHVGIPADWHDAAALDRMLSDEDTDVLVLDGPIDTVNESLLFALSRLDLDTTLILPVGAYGNLRLIAGEIWDHIFYLPTERYIRLPLTPKQLSRSGKNRTTVPADRQRLIGVLSGLRRQIADMPYSSLVLPASVSARFDRPEDGDSWIAPHLALRIYADSGTDATKPAIVAGNDAAKRLMERIGRSRHAG